MNDASNSNNVERKGVQLSGRHGVQKKGGHCSTEHSRDENNNYLQVDENAGPLQMPEVPRMIKFHLHNPWLLIWIVYEMIGHIIETKWDHLWGFMLAGNCGLSAWQPSTKQCYSEDLAKEQSPC